MSIRRFGEFVRNYWPVLGAAFAAFWFLTTLIVTGAWFRWGEELMHRASNALGITELRQMVMEFTGATRIIFQPPGQTYVREPVYVGADVVLVFMAGRTEVGEKCRYVNAIPLYTDEDGVTTPGEFKTSGAQYSQQVQRRELIFSMPARVDPGRVSMQLQLEYHCPRREVNSMLYPEGTFYELTYPVVFHLLPRQPTPSYP